MIDQIYYIVYIFIMTKRHIIPASISAVVLLSASLTIASTASSQPEEITQLEPVEFSSVSSVETSSSLIPEIDVAIEPVLTEETTEDIVESIEETMPEPVETPAEQPVEVLIKRPSTAGASEEAKQKDIEKAQENPEIYSEPDLVIHLLQNNCVKTMSPKAYHCRYKNKTFFLFIENGVVMITPGMRHHPSHAVQFSVQALMNDLYGSLESMM